MSFSKIKKFLIIALFCICFFQPFLHLKETLEKGTIDFYHQHSYQGMIEFTPCIKEKLRNGQGKKIGFFYLMSMVKNTGTKTPLYNTLIPKHRQILNLRVINKNIYDSKNEIIALKKIVLRGELKMEVDDKDIHLSEESTKKKDDNSLKSWLQTILVAIILAAIIKHFIFNTTLVKGPSMEPTLHENDRMICLVFPLYYSNPERGDIIILDAPDEKKEYVKRVIGIPGDEIEIVNGKVYVNGEIINEAYIDTGLETLTNFENRWTLDEDDYFVLGDNRHPSKSVDSRYFGPIPRSSIRSIAKFRYFPFSRVGTL
ncbi:MAG: signal peptidase I [Tissierellia bacterium]|nr:signal peptidase I [Tissierellia bacterium]